MTLNQQLIFLFSALGAINGFLLSCYFLFLKKEKRLSDFFLGGLLLMISMRIIKSAFLHFNPHLFQLFIQIGLSACLFIGPFLFLYIANATLPNHKLAKTWPLYLIPSFIFLGWLIYHFPYDGPPNSWSPYVRSIYKTWLAGILASAFLLRHIMKKLFLKREKLNYEEKWLLHIFSGVTLVYLAYLTGSYTSYIVGALSFSFIFYISILLYLYQRYQRPIATDTPIKYASSGLSEEEAQKNMALIQQIMQTDKLYLDPELSLSKLSEQLGITSKVLSQSINQVSSQNYSKYIAQLRVAEAKRLLSSSTHQHFKIAAIAYESGFNSLSSFNAAFKEVTGKTAKEFRNQPV
ncbi:MAG: helix-turn-helix domain-containing protein [Bacteroidota bacterium]